jgi:mRNA degradation ribonuclease J1/J2|tara:strand:- start:36 stop:287 length:252 start_codon:yes stop_codon:yes gene_type:complete
MRFNYGYQDMPSDVIANGNRHTLEKVTNLKEGSCILICKATNATISSYTSYEKGLKDMAMQEYRDTLLDIKEYIYINDKIREY